jgi:hypothetical protein
MFTLIAWHNGRIVKSHDCGSSSTVRTRPGGGHGRMFVDLCAVKPRFGAKFETCVSPGNPAVQPSACG